MPHGLSNTAAGSGPRNTWRTAAYIRLSREDGNDESYSVVNQKSILDDYIATHDDLHLHGFYIDDGISGTGEARPAYLRMVRDIEEGLVECVVVKDLSRLFRNSAGQTRFLEEFRVRHSLRFISLRLPFIDTLRHPETLNFLSIEFQGMINENHCRETSLKVRDVFDMKRRRGEFIGSFAPYGYRKDPANKNHLLIDEEAASTVRRIYRQYTQGMSIRAIAADLTALGIPNPTAYKRMCGLLYRNPQDLYHSKSWQAKTVRSILSNPAYIGNLVQRKQSVKSYKVRERVSLPPDQWIVAEHTHDAIVEPPIFALAQRLLGIPLHAPPAYGKVHPFSGLVRCASCGRAMHRKCSRSGQREYAYYACRTPLPECPHKPGSIREDLLYRILLTVIRMQVVGAASPDDIMREVEHAAPSAGASRRLLRLLKQKDAQREQIRLLSKELYADWKRAILSEQEYLDLKRGYTDDLRQLAQEAQHIRREYASQQSRDPLPPQELRALLDGQPPTGLERSFLATLVRQVSVQGSGQLKIHFLYANPFPGTSP